MSKDNRHDGRRRGAGQHRLGLRVSQGVDGRERSGSNSSGSSHGGGKSKCAATLSSKVCINYCIPTHKETMTVEINRGVAVSTQARVS